MTYVIGSGCVDVMDKSCVGDCPVDCIYEGSRMLYINPDECVDCGACAFICRMDAIYYETDLPQNQRQFFADNAAFFAEVLPGRDDHWVRPVAQRRWDESASTRPMSRACHRRRVATTSRLPGVSRRWAPAEPAQ